jgi:hypothetical protein
MVVDISSCSSDDEALRIAHRAAAASRTPRKRRRRRKATRPCEAASSSDDSDAGVVLPAGSTLAAPDVVARCSGVERRAGTYWDEAGSKHMPLLQLRSAAVAAWRQVKRGRRKVQLTSWSSDDDEDAAVSGTLFHPATASLAGLAAVDVRSFYVLLAERCLPTLPARAVPLRCDAWRVAALACWGPPTAVHHHHAAPLIAVAATGAGQRGGVVWVGGNDLELSTFRGGAPTTGRNPNLVRPLAATLSLPRHGRGAARLIVTWEGHVDIRDATALLHDGPQTADTHRLTMGFRGDSCSGPVACIPGLADTADVFWARTDGWLCRMAVRGAAEFTAPPEPLIKCFSPVTALAPSTPLDAAAGHPLLLGHRNGRVALRDLHCTVAVEVARHAASVVQLAAVSGSSFVARCTDGMIATWDVRCTARPLCVLAPAQSIRHTGLGGNFAVHQEGHRVTFSSGVGQVTTCRPDTGSAAVISKVAHAHLDAQLTVVDDIDGHSPPALFITTAHDVWRSRMQL